MALPFPFAVVYLSIPHKKYPPHHTFTNVSLPGRDLNISCRRQTDWLATGIRLSLCGSSNCQFLFPSHQDRTSKCITSKWEGDFIYLVFIPKFTQGQKWRSPIPRGHFPACQLHGDSEHKTEKKPMPSLRQGYVTNQILGLFVKFS